MTRRPWIAVPAWIATLLAGLAVLARPSSPALAAPPLRDPAMWSDWAAGRTPVEVGLAVIRVLAVGAGWYLVAVTVLAVLARLSGRARLLRMSDLVTIPALRPLLFGMAGVSLTVPAVAAPAFADSTRPAPPVMVVIDRDEAPPVMRQLPPTVEPVAPPTQPAPARPAPPSTVTVRPGDHLWGIAERTLRDASDSAPTDSTITAYWQALIQLNRDRLVDRGNPDLIYPGQVFQLPPLPVPPPPG